MRSKHFSTRKRSRKQREKKKSLWWRKGKVWTRKWINLKLMFRCFNFHFNLFMFCNSNYQSLALQSLLECSGGASAKQRDEAFGRGFFFTVFRGREAWEGLGGGIYRLGRGIFDKNHEDAWHGVKWHQIAANQIANNKRKFSIWLLIAGQVSTLLSM